MLEGFNKVFQEAVDINTIKDVDDNISYIDCNENLNTDFINNISDVGIERVRELSTNVDNVLLDIETKIEEASSELEVDSQIKRIETYKGTIFEDLIKDNLSNNFADVDRKQIKVHTELGDTKPDIVLRDANENLIIGNTEVNVGEDLFCEVKCGKKEYLESEMSHIEKQVLGHQDGQSVVIMSKDYLDIDPEKRAVFESRLEQLNSSICVIDIDADEVEAAIIENIILQ